MLMVILGPTALNFGYDFVLIVVLNVLLVHFLGHPICTYYDDFGVCNLLSSLSRVVCLSVRLLHFILTTELNGRGAKRDVEKTPKSTHLNCEKARQSTQGYFAHGLIVMMMMVIMVRKIIVMIIVMIFSDYNDIIAPLNKLIMLHYGDGNHVDSQGPPPARCWSRRCRRQRDFPRRHSQS